MQQNTNERIDFGTAQADPIIYRDVVVGGIPSRIAELEERIVRDPLTDLHNGPGFETKVNSLIEKNIPVMIAGIDLDHFKLVNDTLGHKTGDELLKDVADEISKTIRETDIWTLAARAGGDEFLVAFQLTQKEGMPFLSYEDRIAGIIKHMDNFRKQFLIKHPELLVDSIRFNISMGFAYSINGDKSVGELREEADSEMYEVKEQNHKLSEENIAR